MKDLEISARTVEEATSRALEQLGLRLDQVEIEVLDEGKSGLLGIGSEPARIKVTAAQDFLSPGGDVVSCTSEVLQSMLDQMGLIAGISCEQDVPVVDEESPVRTLVFDIKGEDLGILIGRRGQTLACLQYITRLIVSRHTDAPAPIVLDVNGYKKRRYESLRTLAHHVAEQVEVNGRSFTLEPMPAYERRIIHLTLAEHPGVTTESVGFGEARKVVVLPRCG